MTKQGALSGRTPAAPPGRNEIWETKKDRHLSQKVLVREAMKVADDHGLRIRHVTVRRLVARYLESGRSDIDFRTWFIAYVDPVGEVATRNVLRERGF